MEKISTDNKKFAFNTPNIDCLLILIDLCKKFDNRFIIQISEKLVKVYGIEILNSIIKEHKEIWFSLDHSTDLEIIKKCTKENNWSSVLFDASNKTIDENIKLSNQAKNICHNNNTLLECEIGALALKSYSDPEEVIRFANEVNCDLLGIAIGTAHGAYIGKEVNFDLIENIKNKINIPLVAHGGSGLDDSAVKEVFKKGIFKLNISTSLKNIYLNTIKEKDKYNINEIKQELSEKIETYIKQKLNLVEDG